MNIILIVLDTARAKNFSFYGYDKETTPNLAKLLEDSVLYRNAFANSPWTLPSHASFFTGQYTSQHRSSALNKIYSPKVKTMPELLKEQGFNTVAISSNSWISRNFGFDKGFDRFYNTWQILPSSKDFIVINQLMDEKETQERIKKGFELLIKDLPRNIVNSIYGKFFYRNYDYGARRINRIAKKVIQQNKNGNLFLFINYLEPHLEYKPPRGFRKFLKIPYSDAMKVNQNQWQYIFGRTKMSGDDFNILRQLYDCELYYLDYRLGQLLEMLKKYKMYDNSMIIITSDHGENIGEHGLMDHQYCLYDTLLEVPLIIKYPVHYKKKNMTEQSLVQSLDIYPTILDVISVKKPEYLEGLSLLEKDEIRKRKEIFAEYLGPQPSRKAIFRHVGRVKFPFERSLISLRTSRYKFIWSSDGRYELYNIRRDSEEVKNIVPEQMEINKILLEKIFEFRSRFHQSEKELINEALLSIDV